MQMTHDGTLILEKYRQAAAQDVKQGQYHYGGLEIHAWRGIHESVGSIAGRVFATGSAVLDMAAGSGAMCLRLRDAGLIATGCDLVSENFRLHDSVPFILANLNQDFPAGFHDSFDGVTATEIIEHLENPRHFLRQCFSILKPGGHLILTTPNVDSAIARAIWVRSGTFKWFTERDYRNEGHITPLPLMVLRNALSEAGFRIVEVTSAGEEHASILSWWKIHALAAVLRAADGCDTPQKVALVVLAQKPTQPIVSGG
jgi:SAM-dependent methyltransferase